MSRGQSYFITLIRNRTRHNPNTQIRSLSVECRDEIESTGEPTESSAISNIEMAKTVSTIMRERPKWEQTLVSDFPSFNFVDPLFLQELLKSQNNVLSSLWFFQWLSSNNDYKPDPASLNLLFCSLLDSKALKAAKTFLDTAGFHPEPMLLEEYIKSLCEEGLVEEGVKVYTKLKEMDIVPSVTTGNSILSACLKAKKLDLSLELLHQGMTEEEVDINTLLCLIQALCDNRQVSEGYEVLKRVLKQGVDPGHVVYTKLISAFCEEENYACMSEVLHTMIAYNHSPNLNTYHEIILGLCKKRMHVEAFIIFNDLIEKGYNPGIVVYTTMIHGLCKNGWFDGAKKLWFDMIKKGMRPNGYTYNVMIHAHLKIGEVVVAQGLYSEMVRNGYGDTTFSCNRMITGFCMYGRTEMAFELFKRMAVRPDVITYNALVQGFCKENKVEKGIELFKELKELGMNPSGATIAVLQRMKSLKMSDSVVAASLNEILEC